MDILDKYGIKATFFCVGDNVRKYPETFRLVVDKGHRTGNHTIHHLKKLCTPTADYIDNYGEHLHKFGKFRHLYRPAFSVEFSKARRILFSFNGLTSLV